MGAENDSAAPALLTLLEARILEELGALRAEVRALRGGIAPQTPLPAEVTLAQAMTLTNHRSASAFYRWCKRKRVRSLYNGRYALRRLQAAMAA